MRGSEATIEFSHRTPPRPRLIVGISLVLLAAIGWTGTVSALTASVSLCLVALGLTLARSGLPRREVTRVDASEGVVTSRLGSVALAELERVELRVLPSDLAGHARAAYAAVGIRQGGDELTLLTCTDPSELIGFGRAFQDVLRVTVSWTGGNPSLRDWLDAPAPTSPQAARRVRGRAYARQRNASAMTWVVALGLGITWAYFLMHAERTPSLLSLLLALGSLAFALFTAALVTFDFVLVTVGSEIQVERRILGVSVRRFAIALEDVLRVAALTTSNEGGHLLLVTRDSAMAIPLAPPAVQRVAELLSAS